MCVNDVMCVDEEMGDVDVVWVNVNVNVNDVMMVLCGEGVGKNCVICLIDCCVVLMCCVLVSLMRLMRVCVCGCIDD